MTAMLITIELIAALAVMWQSIAALNRMTVASCQTIAFAWVALGGAAVAELVDLYASHSADWHTAAILAAVAWMGAVDRRRRP